MNCSYFGFPIRLLFSLGIKIVYVLTSLVFYICIANSTPQFSPHQLSPADVQMQQVLCKLILLTQSLPEGSSWLLATQGCSLCLGHSCHSRAAFTLALEILLPMLDLLIDLRLPFPRFTSSLSQRPSFSMVFLRNGP